MSNRVLQESFRLNSSETGQNNHTRMDLRTRSESSEISSILGYNNEILLNAAGENFVVGIPSATLIERMNNIVPILSHQFNCHPRRQAFIQKEPHLRSL